MMRPRPRGSISRSARLLHQEYAGEVDVDHLPPYRVVHLVDVEVTVEDAGVVDQHLQRTQVSDGRADCRLDLRSIAHIGPVGLRAGNLRCRLSRGALVEVDHGEREAALAERKRAGAPDAGAGTGDQSKAGVTRHRSEGPYNRFETSHTVYIRTLL